MQVSFRDPDGFVVRHEGRVYRYVLPHAVEQVRSFLSSRAAAKWILEGALAGTAILSVPHASLPGPLRDDLPSGAIVLEHQPLPFTNYPHEWPAEMLHAAAIRTISMATEALEEGFVLKDATPYNVMFSGPKAVFLDVLSFEPREPRDPLWRPYAQFVRTFLYPLLVYRDLDIAPGETLALHRDGLNTEQVAKMLPGMRRFLPPRLGLVAIPAFLSRKKASENPEQFRERKTSDEGEARFLLRRVLDRAMKLTHRLAPAQKREALAYETENSYSTSEIAAKDAFLPKAISKGSRVLDIGCNTGRYSILRCKAVCECRRDRSRCGGGGGVVEAGGGTGARHTAAGGGHRGADWGVGLGQPRTFVVSRTQPRKVRLRFDAGADPSPDRDGEGSARFYFRFVVGIDD